jgi:hypothetical protein
MKRFRALLPVFCVLTLTFSVRTAKADCVDYYSWPDQKCSGAGGCEGTYPVMNCTFGCVSGDCENNVNSGLCCGHQYFLPQIYPDGGACTGGHCDGGGGGLLRRVQDHLRTAPSPHAAELLHGYSPGLIMLSAHQSIKPSTIVYVVDRCKHNYAPVIEEGKFVASGGL